MTFAFLFGKLQEHEIELGRLQKHENKETNSKKAYIAWNDKEVSSSSDLESEEHANLTLMASQHSDDEYEEVSTEFSSYDNDAQSEINELLNECKIL